MSGESVLLNRGGGGNGVDCDDPVGQTDSEAVGGYFGDGVDGEPHLDSGYMLSRAKYFRRGGF